VREQHQYPKNGKILNMVKVTIGNSVSKLEELSLQQFKELRDILSYQSTPQQRYFSRSYGNGVKYLLSKRGEFPTGLLYLVETYFSGFGVTYNDTRRVPVPYNEEIPLVLGYTPYLEQIDAALTAKALGRGIIVAPTGVGKSVIIALILKYLKVKALVIVPSLELKKQLTNTLSTILPNNTHITIMNVDSINIGDKTQYDCVIIDEFHHSGAKTYRKLNQINWKNTYYKFGLTATPFRSKDNERLLLESVLSQVIYEISYKTAVEKKYIVPMEAFYIEVPMVKIKGDKTSWPTMYSELVVNNKTRNEVIHRLLITFLRNQLSTICLVKEINHGEILSNRAVFNFVCGANDERYLIDYFNNGTIKTLIGTDSILGEGIDTKPCEVIIIAGLGRSKNRFMQSCGRAFRSYIGKTSCKVIIIKDLSHRWCVSHFKEQCKILKEEYDTIPTQLFI
jgi:superfamily II DNA or RNA helicase